MRILFCSSSWLTRSLGAAKHLLELAEALEALGWDCEVLSIPELARSQGQSLDRAGLSIALHRHLQERRGSYDIVDYDHGYLPYPRAEFDPSTLMVARSVLLAHHLAVIPLPPPRGLRPLIGSVVKRPRRRRDLDELVTQAHRTVVEADLISVSNVDDRARLLEAGIPSAKIFVAPLAISDSMRTLFDRVPEALPARPVVAFVGTFAPRKGARDIPVIVSKISDAVPGVRFRLLGTRGMHATTSQVLRYFPRRLREVMEVVPEFDPQDLPELLTGCSVGLFPSYVEGFGLGVLEMLAASVPVVAYDAPGPSMMLTPEYLVASGDKRTMARKVIELLSDERRLAIARNWARERSREFRWSRIAKRTAEEYSSALQKLRSRSSLPSEGGTRTET